MWFQVVLGYTNFNKKKRIPNSPATNGRVKATNGGFFPTSGRLRKFGFSLEMYYLYSRLTR